VSGSGVTTGSLAGNLGLSDAIVMAGAAVHLSNLYDKLKVFCWRKNHRSIASFYVDHPKIGVIPIDSEDEVLDANADDVLRTGWYSDIRPISGESWDKWFYRQLKIPFEVRWTSCPIAAASKKVQQRDWPLRTSLVHDDVPRHEITQLPQSFLRVKEDGQSILNLARAVESASDLHVIDSAVFHLIECLQPRGDLYLHRYAKAFKPVWNECGTRHAWKVIY
jgi:hypothetical protein